jgi:prevent-host-death family protein
MPVVTIHEAKTQLSKLIARVEAGEEIIIARGKEPAARLVPIGIAKRRLSFGIWKGQYNIPDSFFFGPLPEENLKLWDGGNEDPLR